MYTDTYALIHIYIYVNIYITAASEYFIALLIESLSLITN